MATNPAVPQDVAARWRPLSDAEEALVAVLLNDAWLDVSARVSGLSTRIDAGTANVDLVVSVLASMVVRVMRNPEGVKEFSVDDFRQVRDSTLSAGLLYPTPGELDLLSATPGRRVRSVRLVANGDV